MNGAGAKPWMREFAYGNGLL